MKTLAGRLLMCDIKTFDGTVTEYPVKWDKYGVGQTLKEDTEHGKRGTG